MAEGSEKMTELWSLDDWKNDDAINRTMEAKNRSGVTVEIEKMMSLFLDMLCLRCRWNIQAGIPGRQS